MEQEHSVHNSPHLRNLGIDRGFIEQHAEDMNRHFNKIYTASQESGTQFLNEDMVQAKTQTTVAPSPQTNNSNNNANVGANFERLLEQRTQGLQQSFNTIIQDLCKQFSDYTNTMDKRLDQLEAKFAAQQQTQVEVAQPAAQPAPQQEQPAPQQPAELDVSVKEIPSDRSVPQVPSEQAEANALRESVAIDKIFNFSGRSAKR